MNVQTVPNHIVVIPDGNRRWAKKKGYGLEDAYGISASVLDGIIDFGVRRGVRYFTVWPISTKTWIRSSGEIEALLLALRGYVNTSLETYPKRGWRSRTVGRTDRLRRMDPKLDEAISELCTRTTGCSRAQVNMAIDYDGQEEIVRAVNRLLQSGVNEVAHSDIRDSLDLGDGPDPDLLLRFGGDRRLSNFILYQIGYAELYFLDDDLPTFDMGRLETIFDEFAERRYSQ